jgi:hypothetical protein
MDHLKLIPLLFLFSSSLAFASAADFSGQSPFFRNSAGTWINSKDFSSQLSANKLTYDGQYRVQSPTAGRSFPVAVSRAADVDLSRVGGVVKNLAKTLGPVGVGLAVADLVCSTTSICDDLSGGWSKETDIPEVGETAQGNVVGQFQGNNPPFPIFDNLNTAAQDTCDFNGSTLDHVVRLADSGTQSQWQVFCNFGGAPFSQGIIQALISSLSSESLPATDQDWDDAESTMNDIDFVPHLQGAGQDVPVSQPDPFPPANTLVGEKTTTLKDGAGNTIGTQVETTTITLTDNSTVDSPNNFDIKEEKTVINYDINNNITDQSTTINEAPPSEAPAEDDITFDEVTDTVLEEKEVSAPLNTTSWGGGSCPAPIAMNTSAGNFEFDTQPFCDFAEALKPFILIVASILGAFIILRARKS